MCLFFCCCYCCWCAKIHLLSDGTIRIYSRNSENNTSKYPDIISWLPQTYDGKDVKTFIIDAEVVAWDNKRNTILPFQQLSTRKRKDAKETDNQVNVALFAFDLLYINGRSLLREPYQTRRGMLRSTFCEIVGKFNFAQHKDTYDGDKSHLKKKKIFFAYSSLVAD